uniref:Uncharacterized protein n=1 Tax=Aotus nancymaae TaxID=37293 RepID=A0A2K5CJT9_AOTNA
MASLIPPYQLEGKGVRGRPRLLRWRLLPHFRFFAAAALLPRTTTRRASCGHTPGGPRPATPTRPLPFPCRAGQWRSYEWHDLPELGSLQLRCLWKPGKTLGLWGDSFRTPSNRPLSLESANHSPANWLGNVAGCHFPVGLCGTLLPGD